MFSKNLFIFLILYIVPDSYGQRAKQFFRKDYNYMEAFESFYKVHTVPQTWHEAKRVCALESATLWHPENDNEAHELISFWNRTKPNIAKMFVGLSDLLVEGIFETVDGKSISVVYNNWQKGQPDDFRGRQDCVTLRFDGTYLDDDQCDAKFSFTCKKSLQSLDWNYHCNMPYLDYTYNKNNGKCYKLHTTPLNWNEAYAMCQLEQSSLAVINNQVEADYLAKLTESMPKQSVKGKYQRGIYHLGFHNKLNEGWQTVTGSPMNLDADAWFDKCHPNGNDPEQCGSMLYTGRLINIDCDTKSFFVCEHEVEYCACNNQVQ